MKEKRLLLMNPSRHRYRLIYRTQGVLFFVLLTSCSTFIRKEKTAVSEATKRDVYLDGANYWKKPQRYLFVSNTIHSVSSLKLWLKTLRFPSQEYVIINPQNSLNTQDSWQQMLQRCALRDRFTQKRHPVIVHPRIKKMMSYFQKKNRAWGKFASAYVDEHSVGQKKIFYIRREEFLQKASVYRLLGEYDSLAIVVSSELARLFPRKKKRWKGLTWTRGYCPHEKKIRCWQVQRNRAAKQSNFFALATNGAENWRRINVQELQRWTVYQPHWQKNKLQMKIKDLGAKTETEQTRKVFLQNLNPQQTLVIGNGGGGMVGLLAYLAKQYNLQNPSKPLTIIWRGGHSQMNLVQMRRGWLDAAITYDPMLEIPEMIEGTIHPPHHLFTDQLMIIFPGNKKDLFGLRSSKKWQPGLSAMLQIIKKTLLLQGVDEQSIVYISRYNGSAMGEKDQTLFRIAVRILAQDHQVQKAFASYPQTTKELLKFETFLYERWLKHVHREQKLFPMHIMRYALEGKKSPLWKIRKDLYRSHKIELLRKKLRIDFDDSSEVFHQQLARAVSEIDQRIKHIEEALERGFYHLNDRGTQRAWGIAYYWPVHRLKQPLLSNPGQLVVASYLSRQPGTPVGDFLAWLFRNNGGLRALHQFVPQNRRGRTLPVRFGPYQKEKEASYTLGHPSDPYASAVQGYACLLQKENALNQVLLDLRENNSMP